jgi:hypothetical protein
LVSVTFYTQGNGVSAFQGKEIGVFEQLSAGPVVAGSAVIATFFGVPGHEGGIQVCVTGCA